MDTIWDIEEFEDLKGLQNIDIIGLCPTVSQSLSLPSHWIKERTQSQRHRHQWFIGWGNLQGRGKGPGAAAHQVQPAAGRTQKQYWLHKHQKGSFIARVTAGQRVPTALWVSKLCEGCCFLLMTKCTGRLEKSLAGGGLGDHAGGTD